MTNTDNAITATGLTKKFGSFTAVDEIDFRVKKGEIFGFLGPNGSGKTTTIRMTLGLLKPTSGSVDVLGINVVEESNKIRPLVGYMSQKFSLYNDLTVMQNLRFYGAAYGLPNNLLSQRIKEALEMANLVGHEHMKTKDLSGGWRQRLALSASILHRPKVLFLDEPTAGVDPISRRNFWDLLYKLVAQEITVFVTTHYMDEAEHCHRLAFLQRGKVIAHGTPTQIKNQKLKNRLLEITSPDVTKMLDILKEIQSSGFPIREIEIFGSQIHVLADNYDLLMSNLTKSSQEAGFLTCEMNIIEPSLEDVFIASMKEEKPAEEENLPMQKNERRLT